ncbi:MAG: MutS-related protein [Bacillota bacterium]
MDHNVFKNIALDYVFDRITVYTPFGETAKKQMQPYRKGDEDKLLEEYDRIGHIVSLIESQRYTLLEIRNLFKSIKDLRGSFKRVREETVLSTVELFEIKIFIGLLEKLEESLKKLKWHIPGDLEITPIPYLKTLFDPQDSGINTFYIYEEYSEALKAIREEMKKIEGEINRGKFEQRTRIEAQTNIKLRPNGEIIINKSNTALLASVEACEELTYSSETYMNITYKLKMDERHEEMHQHMELLKTQEEEEEFKIRRYLTGEIHRYIEDIDSNIQAIGALDLLVAKGYLAVGMKALKPEIIEEDRIYIEEGRHVKVEDSLRKQEKKFTPITIGLKKGVTCITGANMGGKTITLKLIGLLTAMAQYGLFVPAAKMAFSLRDTIFFSLGDLQSTDMGLSTFGAEIMVMKEMLKKSDGRTLILIDELARGTNPSEGYAISKAIVDYLKDKKAMTVITTHFDGVADGEGVCHLQVRGLSGVDFEELQRKLEETAGVLGIELVHQYMDYRLECIENRGMVPRDAINIARLMGLGEEILKEAERNLEDM